MSELEPEELEEEDVDSEDEDEDDDSEEDDVEELRRRFCVDSSSSFLFFFSIFRFALFEKKKRKSIKVKLFTEIKTWI